MAVPFGVWTLGGGGKEPCIKWGPGSPVGRGTFGGWGHTLACPDLSVVDILNLIRYGAAAMRPPVYCSSLLLLCAFCHCGVYMLLRPFRRESFCISFLYYFNMPCTVQPYWL